MKWLIKAFLFLCVGLAIVCFALDYGLKRGTRSLLSSLEREYRGIGLTVRDIRCEKAGLGWPFQAAWRGGRSKLDLESDSLLTRQAGFVLKVERIALRPLVRPLGSVELVVDSVDLEQSYLAGGSEDLRFDAFWARIDRCAYALPASSLWSRGDLLAEYVALKPLLESGVTTQAFAFEGAFGFKVDGFPIALRCRSEAREGGYGLRADLEGIRDLAARYSEAISEVELDVISRYPLQAPRMLEIKNRAIAQSVEAADRDATVPQDAYRHVLWSFLLTRAFGQDLAREIMDAHEIGSTTNTEADHRMDYNNNEVGIRYALEGRRADELLRLTKSDPQVIRSPR